MAHRIFTETHASYHCADHDQNRHRHHPLPSLSTARVTSAHTWHHTSGLTWFRVSCGADPVLPRSPIRLPCVKQGFQGRVHGVNHGNVHVWPDLFIYLFLLVFVNKICWCLSCTRIINPVQLKRLGFICMLNTQLRVIMDSAVLFYY